MDRSTAFGKPGAPPNWAKASKHGIGTSISLESRVWFTITDGVLTEVYYPTIDIANTRDMKFLITGPEGLFEEEGVHTSPEITFIDPKAPAYIITNTSNSNSFIITKKILTDPSANSVLMNVSFNPLKWTREDFRVYILFAPHIKNRGFENSGRCAEYNGRGHLIAWREDIAAALTSDTPFLRMSAGYAGVSDGWHDIRDNLKMDWEFERALDGHIALMAEVAPSDEFNIVLGFGKDDIEAVLEAQKTLARGYGAIEREYVRQWRKYINGLEKLGKYARGDGKLYWASAIVLKCHQDKTEKGGLIASLSVPWGQVKGDKDAGGYHLVWPRDLVKGALAFIAMGDTETPAHTLDLLRRMQNPDGSWPQNFWVNGEVHWTNLQLDQAALPVVLAWKLRAMSVIGDEYYEMAKKAASFIVKNGPVTKQERWEENMGFSPATLAAEVSALVCAGFWARAAGEEKEAQFLLSTADYYSTRLEDWTFSECDCIGENIPGHYLRIISKPPDSLSPGEQVCHALVFVKNVEAESFHHQGELVDAGFTDLVRFGVRAPSDPHVKGSIAVVDKLIRFDSDGKVAFYRYNFDGYGEKEDGSPFDGTGIGRPWPLITGERAMYELMAGDEKEGGRHMKSFESFANEGLLFPEQVWDRDDIPGKGLFKGKGTGAATPLMWAHSEYIKLLRTGRDGKGCDLIDEVWERYARDKTRLDMSVWKKNRPIYIASAKDIIRIISFEKTIIRWTKDGWATQSDSEMTDPGLGLFYLDFPPFSFESESALTFTFHYTGTGSWEGRDYGIKIF